MARCIRCGSTVGNSGCSLCSWKVPKDARDSAPSSCLPVLGWGFGILFGASVLALHPGWLQSGLLGDVYNWFEGQVHRITSS
jgi:hypothetical protein